MHTISAKVKFSIAIFFVAFLFSSTSFAQAKKPFPLEHPAFLDAFGEFLTKSKSKDVQEAEKLFATEFNSLYTPEERDSIIAFVNTLKLRRYSAKPYFLDYVTLIAALKKDTDNPSGFANWHDIAKKILKSEKKPDKTIKQLIKFAGPFLTEKAFKKKGSGIIWSVDEGSSDWKYENQKLYVEFKDVNLLALRRVDSLLISKTSGRYYIRENVWKGKGGQVSWEKVGYDDVFAKLSNYRIDCRKGLYRADSVLFTSPYLSAKPIMGSLSDKVTKRKTNKTYPQFQSYGENYTVKNVSPGIELYGGIKLEGPKIYVATEKERSAIFSYHPPQNPKNLFRCRGKSFKISKGEKITGQQVETAIYFNQDSIFHPSVTITYSLEDNDLRLSRADRGSDRNPYFNSFYQVNIDVDKITYNVKQEKVLIGDKKISIDKVKDEVTFESVNFFDEATFIRYQGVGSTNPISKLLRHSTQTGDRDFSEEEVASIINAKVDAEGNKRLLYQMAADGFIFYDTDNGWVTLRDKLFHYGRAASGNADFDPINLVSKSKDANAVFDIKKGETDINEVQSLVLSKKQQVAVKPLGSQLKMLKNRDLEFNGSMYAGMTVFEGNNMRFNYDKFNVQTDSVRFLDFYVPTGKLLKNKRKEAVSMDSRIEYLTGYLLIDAPQNKSGKKDIPIFPSFASKASSFVYYDREDIIHGQYKRDSFYFELKPFTFNGLDSYKKEDLKFKGSLVSADILPPFKETLVLREDMSLGFAHQTPTSGYTLYQNRGKYTGELDLSNKGFWGMGLVNYLTASIQSEDILFKPVELTCTAKIFDMKEDRNSSVKVPKVNGETVKVRWEPYVDSMYITTKKKPFDLFLKPNYTLNGTLILTPEGAKGQGVFDWDGGELRSKLMDLGPFSAKADTADLRIKAIGESGIALNTKNLKGILDFDKMMGSFEANNDTVVTTLPQNKYMTTMNKFDWDMTKGLINFKAKPGERAAFTSIHETQDSLTFNGETAQYNLKTAELNITGVPFIVSCDAMIYPQGGKVDIKKGAKITTLENARIVADTANKYHEFTKVTADILGRKDYKAKGYYLYNLPARNQEILFDNIMGQRFGKGKHSVKATLTTATTEVEESTSFYIDERTKFKGTISLRANEKKLDFDGFAKLDIPEFNGDWFSIASKGDKENLVITLNKPKNPEGMPLGVGIFLSKEKATMYPRMIQSLYLRKDRPIIDCMGQFKFNKKNSSYVFGDSTRVNNYGARGNFMEYFTANKLIKADGVLNLGSGLDFVKVDAAGVVETKLGDDKGELVVNLMAGIDFKYPEALMRIISADIQSSLLDLKDGSYENSFFTKVLPNMIQKQKDLIAAKESIGARSLILPKSFSKYEVFFSKMQMKWLPEYQSFMTTSKKNLLGAFDGKPVNKTIRSYVEIKMPSNDDDRIYIYLKLPNDNFYFFGYQGGILSTCSNNDVFNNAVEKIKVKHLTFKMKDNKGVKGVYVVETVNPLTAQLFVKRVNTAVRGQ